MNSWQRMASRLRRSKKFRSFEIGTRIASEPQRHPIESRAGAIPMTCSIGVARFEHDGGSLGELLDTADRYLYRAEQAGRNRVVGEPVKGDQDRD